MQQLELNPLFAKHFSRLSPEQLKRLEQSLLNDVTTEPIIYWHNSNGRDEILDGHHRYQIALDHGLDLKTHEKYFKSEDEALYWVIRNQTNRRNLDIGERNQAFRKAVDLEIKIEGKTKAQAIDYVAETAGVSVPTMYRALSEPKDIIQRFKETKKEYEARTAKEKEKLVAEIQIQGKAEGWDDDRMADEWQTAQERLQENIESDPEFVEMVDLAEQVQGIVEDAPHLKRELSEKRGPKKSAVAKRERTGSLKKALTAINKALDAIDSVSKIVDTTSARVGLKRLADMIGAVQIADNKEAAKKRFGR